MSRTAKYVSQIISVSYVASLGYSMVVPAIHPLSAATSCVVDAEVRSSSIHLICLRIARIDLWLKFVHTDRSFLFLIGVAVSQILVVPNVVVVVAFYISSIFLEFCYLPACWLLHPRMHLQLL